MMFVGVKICIPSSNLVISVKLIALKKAEVEFDMLVPFSIDVDFLVDLINGIYR